MPASPVSRQPRKKRLGTAITFTVAEGKPSAITAIEISGLEPAEQRKLEDAIGISVGDRFDYAAYDRGKARIISTLRQQGYAHARLQARAKADRNRRGC